MNVRAFWSEWLDLRNAPALIALSLCDRSLVRATGPVSTGVTHFDSTCYGCYDELFLALLPANSPRRLARPRTSPFHGGNTGSNPVGDANRKVLESSSSLGWSHDSHLWRLFHFGSSPRLKRLGALSGPGCPLLDSSVLDLETGAPFRASYSNPLQLSRKMQAQPMKSPFERSLGTSVPAVTGSAKSCSLGGSFPRIGEE